MARTAPFESAWRRYEEWFDRHPHAYAAELEAVRGLLPRGGRGLEVGVGSGRFAAPLRVEWGLDPSATMCRLARERGVGVVRGVAERLPFADGVFDYVLMITTICFLDDVDGSFTEVRRVLRPSGGFLVGFVDRDSSLGRLYQEHKEENPFYSLADFYSTEEVVSHLRQAGFGRFRFAQTIFHRLPEVTAEEPVMEGSGRGSFIVVASRPTG